jgi:glc operon protein GlcG
MKLPIVIAVVDAGGHLLAFARIDDAKPSSVPVAITKATSAALRRTPTGPMPNAENTSVLLSLGMPLATDGVVTCIRGGGPLLWEGSVIGGIGVSAGTEAQDEEVARAGAAALR